MKIVNYFASGGILCILLVWTTLPVSARSCDFPYRSVGRYCLLFITAPSATWYEARNTCLQKYKGSLVAVDTEEKYNAISNYLVQNIGYPIQEWSIGGTDTGLEGKYYWDTTGAPFTFTAWHPYQPDNFQGIQNCIVMGFSNTTMWDDNGCTSFRGGFICEKIYYPCVNVGNK